MKLQNPYTKGYIEYPLYFEPNRLSFQVRHETPFTERFSEWQVALIETGDMIYIPCGQNRCRNIYIVTKYYRAKMMTFPHGIYTLPLYYFTQPAIGDKPSEDIVDDEYINDYFDDDDDDDIEEDGIDDDDENFDYANFFSTHSI